MRELARFTSAEGLISGPDALDSQILQTPGVEFGLESRHVLILDDEAPVRKLARAVIEPMGATCHEAGDGLTALELISNYPIDMILIDLRLPEMNGYDVFAQRSAHPPRPHLKIILMSGFGNADEAPRLWNMGPMISCPNRWPCRNWRQRSSINCG